MSVACTVLYTVDSKCLYNKFRSRIHESTISWTSVACTVLYTVDSKCLYIKLRSQIHECTISMRSVSCLQHVLYCLEQIVNVCRTSSGQEILIRTKSDQRNKIKILEKEGRGAIYTVYTLYHRAPQHNFRLFYFLKE